MAFHEIKVQEEVAANLVPMIDIMFLLLLFFMLNADMSQRELEDVVPPTANKAQEDKSDENADRITCNVFHHVPECPAYTGGIPCSDKTHWMISTGGQHYPINDKGLGDLTNVFTELANTRRSVPGDRKSPSERHMIIRGDRLAPYGFVQRSLECAARAGLYKIEVAAQIEKSSVNKE